MARANAYAAASMIALSACSADEDPLARADVMPALVSSSPGDGEIVARTTWIVLSFVEPPASPDSTDFALRCGASTPIEVAGLSDGRVVINPMTHLPDGAPCDLRWRGPAGIARLDLRVADRGPDALVVYDRNEATSLAPLPDDVWMAEDETTRTGSRVDIPELAVAPSATPIVEPIRVNANTFDGWSPLAPWVIALDAEIDPATLPRSPLDSLDPVATVALFDLRSETRVPFYLWNRNEINRDESPSNVLLLWPAQPLDPRGKYGLIVSNRALVSLEQPLEASAFMEAVLTAPTTDAEHRAAGLTREVMDVAGRAEAPFRDDDVALVLRASIRSIDDVVADHMAVWEHVRDMPVPSFSITDVVADTELGSDVAAFVHGTWVEPDWVATEALRIRRDPSGRPVAEGTREVDFVIALPRASLDGPAPLVMFQHGQPGNAETQVPCEARTHLAGAGFAVAGFTNYLNRDLAGYEEGRLFLRDFLVTGSFTDLTPAGPLYLGEQLAFVKLLTSLTELDVLPIGSPDGVPDIDPSKLLYLGQSAGGGQALSLLAFEPLITAAALNVPGSRSWSLTLHQDGGATYRAISGLFPGVTLPMFDAGIALMQMMQDYADPLLMARFVHRERLDLGAGGKRASVLMTEGLGDILVPTVATRAAAWALDIPMVQPALETEPFLEAVSSPATGNLGEGTTGALAQYDPTDGTGDIAHCFPDGEPDPADGHQYTQDAPPARAQRIHFFQTAITDPAPTIVHARDWGGDGEG